MTESENLADAEQEVTKPLVSAKAVMTAKKKKKKKEKRGPKPKLGV